MSTNEVSINKGAARDGAPPVALIAGPTASGKSDLAVALALALRDRGNDAVVINADSAQVYRDLRILSARPTEEDMQGIPHRLFGAWDGATPCSAADWAARARAEIDAAHRADAVPIVVGGTGLYLRTLIDGIAPVPPIDPAIREAVRAMPVEDAYRALSIEDAPAAGRLAPADTTRVARALEVVRSTGHPLSYWQTRKTGGIGPKVSVHGTVLLPPRDWLYSRCDQRFAAMLHDGAVEEVQVLLSRDLPPVLPVMRAIGVPEIAQYLSGAATLDQVREQGALATRRYAKRQYTWFQNQPPEEWTKSPYDNDMRDDLVEIILRQMRLT